MSAWKSNRNTVWTDLERNTALIVNAEVVIGDVTVDLTPTDVPLTAVNDTTTVDFNIPAGVIRGSITNMGGENPVNILVNGQELAPGASYMIAAVYAGNNFYLPPAYAVVTNGSLVSYYYEEP